ncbi:MAG: helix-hairpin-helix domain-containing protein [Actinomycetota bacterium]|nr:helix-hairpin-helix domain-containing protein [Actinomycetota bacterium]
MRLPFPLTRRRALFAAAAGVVLLVLAGKLAGAGAPTGAPPPPPTPVPTNSAPSRLVVDVVGAVRQPGLYRLAQGARIADAVTRAGGVTPRADLELINLAAPLADGEQVVVPRRGAGAGDTGSSVSGAGASPSGPVHLNNATLEQLDSLPGVGPVTAQKILDYREQHGAFSSVDALDAVPGIGPARLDTLRELVAP